MSKPVNDRIVHLVKRRELEREGFEKQRQLLEEQQGIAITERFTSNVETPKSEVLLPTDVVGLVNLEEMKEKHLNLLVPNDSVITGAVSEEPPTTSKETKEKEPDTKSRIKKNVLSFQFDDGDEDEEVVIPVKKGRLGMDPMADTSFMPDPEKELEIAREKERLAREWRELQEKEKNEDLTVSFCYWDGSSHQKYLKVTKGHTISQFLAKALEFLRKEFSELKPANPENLMFVKEDLIIPHFYTFQDFIVTRAMGKSGPLWVFDSASEIRMRQEASVDVSYSESHPAKVVLRHWFEKNKHIYPANRWEGFVPNKVYKKNIDDDPNEDL